MGSLVAGGGFGGEVFRAALGFIRSTAGPGDLEAHTSQEQDLGVLDDANGEQITFAVVEFRQALLFRAQGIVRFVERDTELVLAGDKRAGSTEQLACFGHRRQRSAEDQLVVGIYGKHSIG